MRLKILACFLLLGVLPARAQSILGTVIDEASREPIAAVSLALTDANGAVLRNVTTDENGRFVVIAPAAGEFRVRAERLGYAKSQTVLFYVADDETVTIEITLPVTAIELAPITVQRSARVPAMLQDFYARKNRQSGGVFFDREDIRKRNPLRLTDLLRDVPGLVTSAANSAGGRSVQARRQNTLASCPLKVFVDGRQYRQFDASSIDMFTPSDLDGVEVYKGLAEVPAEFGGDDARCGVLALWTRRPNVPYQNARAERGTELRFMAALSATVLLVLLRR